MVMVLSCFRRRTGGSGRAASTATHPVLASTLLEHLADGVIACNADGSTLTFNRRAREIFGSPDHEVSDEDCPKYFGLYSPGDVHHMPVEDLPLARALRGERVRDALVEVRPHDGLPRIVSVSGEPVTGRHRRIDGAVIVLQDVTARLESEAALALQRAVAEHMPQGVVLTRADDGDIVYVNGPAERMFGYGRGDLLGRPMSSLNVGTTRTPTQRAREILHALERDGTWSGTEEKQRSDGTRFTSAVTVTPLELPEHGPLWLSIYTEVPPTGASPAPASSG